MDTLNTLVPETLARWEAVAEKHVEKMRARAAKTKSQGTTEDWYAAKEMLAAIQTLISNVNAAKRYLDGTEEILKNVQYLNKAWEAL